MKFLLKLSGFFLILLFLYFWFRPPIYKRQIVFENSYKAVQDSMLVLRKICEPVNNKDFINCITVSVDGDTMFIFNTVSLGSFTSVDASNVAFKDMKRSDVVKLISTMKFLNRNHISGVFHDTSIGLWLYPYGTHFYDRNREYVRNLYVWKESKDTLTSSFKYYYKIIDRKEKIVLVAHNNVPYQPFQK